MGSLNEKQSNDIYVVNLADHKSKFPPQLVHQPHIRSFTFHPTNQLIISIREFYREYNYLKGRENRIIIFNNNQPKATHLEESDENILEAKVHNCYPILPIFRFYPIISEEKQIFDDKISIIFEKSDHLAFKKQIVFCIKDMKNHGYQRIFINAFQFYQIRVIFYEDISKIPEKYFVYHDLIIGFDQIKDIRKKMKTVPKLKGTIFCFCRKEDKDQIFKSTHIKFDEIRLEIKKMNYSIHYETNILQIIEKIVISGPNFCDRKYNQIKGGKLLFEEGKRRITTVFICVREKSKEDCIIYNSLKKIEKAVTTVTFKKIYITERNIIHDCDPISENVHKQRFSMILIGSSMKLFRMVSEYLEKNKVQDRVIILKKGQENNDQFAERIIKMFKRNQLPQITNQIPKKIIVYGSEIFFRKVLQFFPLFQLKLFLKPSSYAKKRRVKYQVIFLNLQEMINLKDDLCLSIHDNQYVCFDHQSKQQEFHQQNFPKNVIFVSSQRQLVTTFLNYIGDKELGSMIPYTMRYNYYQRKLNLFSDEFVTTFNELRMKNQVIEHHATTDIFFFKCDKEFEFEISERIISTFLTPITNFFYLPEGVLRIKQKVIEQLIYLSQFREFPDQIFIQLAKSHHETLSDFCHHLMQFVIKYACFRKLLNRIFTQILYQNKKQYIQYLPHLFFTLFFSFTKSCAFENYNMTSFRFKLVDYTTPKYLRQFIQKFPELMNCSGQFLVGQILKKSEQNSGSLTIQVKDQIINDFYHFYPFYRKNDHVVLCPLGKLRKSQWHQLTLILESSKYHCFLAYFCKRAFNDEVLLLHNNIHCLIHKLMVLFRRKMNFSAQQLIAKAPSTFPQSFLQNLKVYNLIEQGLLQKAKQQLNPKDPYSPNFVKLIKILKDKVEEASRKGQSSSKKIRHLKWVSSYDEKSQNFLLLNTQTEVQHCLTKNKIIVGVNVIQNLQSMKNVETMNLVSEVMKSLFRKQKPLFGSKNLNNRTRKTKMKESKELMELNKSKESKIGKQPKKDNSKRKKLIVLDQNNESLQILSYDTSGNNSNSDESQMEEKQSKISKKTEEISEQLSFKELKKIFIKK